MDFIGSMVMVYDTLVEIVDESQCVLVMMSCEKGYSDNMVSLRRDVIGEVMSVYKESCPSLEVEELVIDPKELAYPVNTPRERTVYSVKDILSAIDKREEFLVKCDGTKGEKVKEILADESLSDISNLSLLGGRDIKEVIEKFNTPLATEPASQKVNSNCLSTQISEYNNDQQKVIWTIENLVEVKQVLKDSNFQTIKWFDLGLHLGLSYDDLKTIEHNYPRDAEQCLTECLAKWLKKDSEATRNKLSIAAGKAIDKREDNLSLLGGKGDGGVKCNNNKDKGTTTNTLNESQEHGSTSIEKGQSDIDVLKINDEVQETLTDKLLDIRDLATVLQELTSNQQFDYTDWKFLGLYLGLYERTIKAIEVNCRGQVKDCLMECISSWLKGEDGVRETRGGGSNWISLVAALDAMGEREVADNIRIKIVFIVSMVYPSPYTYLYQ
uniref:Death domain-containing protein n=1 Tax=Amphimedon queenslandica TaxID=400682 RepID=A0A1X7TPL0_AMPQE